MSRSDNAINAAVGGNVIWSLSIVLRCDNSPPAPNVLTYLRKSDFFVVWQVTFSTFVK